jgi:uncharacterized protein (DUF1684 family)
MRAAPVLFACLAGLTLGAAAPKPTPEAEWKAGIADENRDYAQVPHAMLKIQASAYLSDGDVAVLTGRKGDPGSYRWANDPRAEGVLRVTLKGGKIAVAKNGAAVSTDALTKGIAIDRDVDIVGHQTQVDAGVMGWRIFVFNQQNPAAKAFKGVSYFPYDSAYRVKGHFLPDPKRPARLFRTSRGTGKQFYHVGDVVFSLSGKAITLPMYADSNDPRQSGDFTAFFRDDLTGKGAYGYVDVSDFGKFPPSTVTIDFNTAYNPNCARSAHFTCPIAMDEIPLAMKAGERDPHLAH